MISRPAAAASHPARRAGEPVERASHGRIPRRDRLSAGAFVSVELSPIVVPPRHEVVATVRALFGTGAAARAGRTFDGDEWHYDPAALDDQAERAVQELPGWYSGVRSLPALRLAADPRLPFTVFLGDGRAALCIDHRLGDGLLSVLLTTSVFAGRGISPAFLRARDVDPLPAALRETFARHPARVRQVFLDRLTDHGPAPEARPEPDPAVPVLTRGLGRGGGDVLALETGVMEPRSFRSLVEWARGRVPLAVALLFAVRGALVAEGVPVTDAGAILVDLRRYLPSGHATLGNFVVGQPVGLGRGIEAAGTRFTHDLRVGRPLAAHAVGVHRPRQRSASRPASLAVTPTVSDMGMLRSFDPVPWATDRPALSVSVDPASGDGVTALTTVVRRHCSVSLSFDAAVTDADRIRAACDRLTHDPIGLLA